MLDKLDVTAKVAAYLAAMAELGRFSGSVLISVGREVLLCDGYGMADREHAVPNISQTKFRIGSISKQFTAMAILLLEQQGKLTVNDFISLHLPDAPNTWSGVKIRHLLNHSSGIPSLTEFVDQETTGRLPLTLVQWIDTFRDKPVQFKAGTQHHYSNSGYLLLGDIIERVSGLSYESFLDVTLFKPLEMADSGYDRHSKVLPNRATGYREEDNVWTRAPYIDMGFPFAAGALYSTVEDLYRWDQALLDNRLITEEASARMTTITPLLAAYGYGTVIGQLYGKRTLGHLGGIPGFRANLLRFPDEPACIIALCNTESSDFVSVPKTLSAMIFNQEYQSLEVPPLVPLPEALAQFYVGEYEISLDAVLKVEYKDYVLHMTCAEAQRSFIPKSQTRFVSENNDEELKFDGPIDKEQKYLVLVQNGVEVVATRKD